MPAWMRDCSGSKTDEVLSATLAHSMPERLHSRSQRRGRLGMHSRISQMLGRDLVGRTGHRNGSECCHVGFL